MLCISGYSGGPPPQAQPPRGPDPQQKSLPPQHRLPPGQTLRNGSRGGPRSSYSESTAPNVPPSHQHGPPAPRYGQPQPPPEHMKRGVCSNLDIKAFHIFGNQNCVAISIYKQVLQIGTRCVYLSLYLLRKRL